jgi:hypothetical protein
VLTPERIACDRNLEGAGVPNDLVVPLGQHRTIISEHCDQRRVRGLLITVIMPCVRMSQSWLQYWPK